MSRTVADNPLTSFALLVSFCYYIKFIAPKFSSLWVSIAIHLAAILVTVAVKRRKYHGLSKFPGPWLWSASRLPMFWHLCKGDLPQKIAQLHEQYGPVVRIAPTELSFTSEDAWAAIYNKPVGKPQLQKDPTQFVQPSSGIGGLFHEKSDAMHSQVRRNFSHAFAEKTMLEQERIIQSYLTRFLDRIRELDGQPTDICVLLNCLTFDIIGDLVFGESENFDSLHNAALHPWIKNIFTHVATMVIVGMIQKFTLVYSILTTLLRTQIREAEHKHHSFVMERLHKRMQLEVERPDFITHVQKFLNTPNGISLVQLEETINQLIIGGSETTATVLSALLHLLLTHPSSLSTLKTTIRTVFPSSASITISNIQSLTASKKLTYLDAVLNETLRLFPPTPGNMTRVTPATGCTIASRPVPGGMLVGVNLYAAGRARANFWEPERFVPERWGKGESVVVPEMCRGDRLGSVHPFSIGPRNCIGKNLANIEMRLIICKLLFEYDPILQPSSRSWSRDIKIRGFFEKPALMVSFVSVSVEKGEVGGG